MESAGQAALHASQTIVPPFAQAEAEHVHQHLSIALAAIGVKATTGTKAAAPAAMNSRREVFSH